MRLQADDAREEHVVLEVDVLVQLALEAREALVERPVGRAAVLGDGEPATQRAQAGECRAGTVVLFLQRVERSLDVLSPRAGLREATDGRSEYDDQTQGRNCREESVRQEIDQGEKESRFSPPG